LRSIQHLLSKRWMWSGKAHSSPGDDYAGLP
jgi:hypothetical protein